MDEVLARAYRAYFMVANRNGDVPDSPAESSSGHVNHEGKEYVVLRNINRILAVYRVRPHDKILRRMKRWPKAIEDY